MNLTTATPVEIDTVLAGLYAEQQTIGQTIREQSVHLMHKAGAKRTYGRTSGWTMTATEAEAKVREMLANGEVESWYVDSYTKTLAALDEAREALRANHAEQARIGAEYTARGGWTRAFLVTDGHVHSSMQCSTCNNGEYATSFTWLYDFSGRTEAEVIDAAADRACTTCYPNAPVLTAGPSTLMTPDERTRAEKRNDAATAKAERLAKKIANGLTADGSEFKVTYPGYNNTEGRDYFKTEKAAVEWMVRYIIWGDNGTEDKTPAYNAIIEAMMVKHSQTREEVLATINAKIAAKNKRDKTTARYDMARLAG